MTPELLELIKQAQPYLPNEWKVGDRYYDTEYSQIGFVVAVADSNHKYYEGVLESSLPIIYMKYFDVCLPYPYPHQLWQMIDWVYASIENMSDGSVEIYLYKSHEDENPEFIKADLETAVYKAFIWQKENER